jgi:hypothetical protein
MRSAALVVALSVAACAHSAPPKVPEPLRASEVTELSGLPPQLDAGDTIVASCQRLSGLGGAGVGKLVDEPLANLDCSFARLSRTLLARAAELDAKFIFGKACKTRRARLECRATLGVPNPTANWASLSPRVVSGPAPSAEQVLDRDEPRPEVRAQVRVAFEPATPGASASRAPRDYANVAETSWPSVGRAVVGQVSARCLEDCDASALRYALRVTAGRVGAGEVSSVRCFADAGHLRCVGTALAPWSS